ncbi:MAG: hypothetical protein NVSMB13_19890 [Mycobacteriales bacterium]
MSFRRRSDALLVVVDALSALLVAYVAFSLRFEGQPAVPPAYLLRYRVASTALAVVWVLAARSVGLYRRAALRRGSSTVESAFTASLLAGAVVLVGNYTLADGRLSRAWIGLVVFGLLLAGIVTRGALRRFRRALVPLGIALERYAVVGDGPAAARLVGDLTRAAGAPYRIVGTFPADLTPAQLAHRARTDNLDGLIVPAELAARCSAELATELAGSGTDILLAPAVGDLDLRVASIAMFHGVPLLRVAGIVPRRRAERVRARDFGQRGVAIMGTRGVPASYGGFETFAERLALHLVERGLAPVVYGRRRFVSEASPWRGIRLVTLPAPDHKYLETVVHTALSAVHLIVTRGPRDVVLCNAANAPVVPLLRLFGRRVILNVDGLEWRRGKWGVAGRAWYRMGEWLSVRTASVLVTDAHEVRTYYRVRHDSDSVMIPYGADLLPRGLPLPAETPVHPEGYLLYVSRWERENNPVLVASAHAAAGLDVPLVMLGRATYDEALGLEVAAAAGPNALLPGPLFGEAYRGLQSNALAYIHATEVGGTHPALIEAMGAGDLCLVMDTPENREVAGPVGRFFADQAGLVDCLRWAAQLSPDELDRHRQAARAYAAGRYSWTAVGDAYLALMRPRRQTSERPAALHRG